MGCRNRPRTGWTDRKVEIAEVLSTGTMEDRQMDGLALKVRGGRWKESMKQSPQVNDTEGRLKVRSWAPGSAHKSVESEGPQEQS